MSRSRTSRGLGRSNQPRPLGLEVLEDRVVPSWAGTPPTSIPVPASSTAVTLDTSGRASGSDTILTNETDFFRFTPALAGNFTIRVTTPTSVLNPVIGLFGSTGTRVAFNDNISPGDTDSALTASLTAGQTYYLGITNYTGAPSGAYTWSVDGPGTLTGDDLYEDNDTQATAADLGVAAGGTLTVNNLKFADAADWYKFTTTTTGTTTSKAQIFFQHIQGDVELGLYNSAGALLASSITATNTETVSLNGLAAGTYFLKVYGAANPTYTIGISPPGATPPPDDSREENDTLATAYSLGSLVATTTFGSLVSLDDDWYSFTTNAASTTANYVSISFTNSQGNLSLQVYNTSGQLVGSAASTADVETVTLNGLAAGKYYARVFGSAAGVTNLSYTLKVAAPGTVPIDDGYEQNDTQATSYDLGTVTTPRTVGNLILGDAADWYKFTTTATGNVGSKIEMFFQQTQGDLDMALYNSAGTLLASSVTANPSETISLNGRAAGTYFLKVYGATPGATNPNYTLAITPQSPPLPPDDVREQNDTFSTASGLGTIYGTVAVNNLVSLDNDWYSFVTTATGTSANSVSIAFSNASGNLDLQLYNSVGVAIGTSSTAGNTETISLNGRPAGVYYVHAYGASTGVVNPSYSLTISAPGTPPADDNREENDSLGTASNLGTPSAATTIGGLKLVDAADFYKFTVGSGINGSVSVAFTHLQGDLDLRLFNSAGAVVGSSQTAGNTETISLNGMPAGAYTVQVYGSQGAVNPNYSLMVTPPQVTPPPPADAWTLFVYITASNLYDFAFQDINEMEKAVSQLPSSVNVVVYWDQSAAFAGFGGTFSTGNGSQPAWGTAGRAVITADTNTTRVGTTFEILAEQNSGQPSTLSSFLAWGAGVAPAQKYALLLWNHGAGIYGSNYDDSDGVALDSLTITEAASALGAPGVPRLDVVGYDACLMGMAEVGAALKGRADVFVGSEELVPGTGYDYTTLLNPLKTNPASVTAEQLATGFVTSYAGTYVPSAAPDDTNSAIRTSGYAGLETALRAFTDSTLNASSATRTRLLAARNFATQYDGSSYVDFRDLGSFMSRVASDLNIPAAIRTAAGGVTTAITAAVVAKTADSRASSGIAIYLPQLVYDSTYASMFPAFEASTGWGSFARWLVNGSRAPSGSPPVPAPAPVGGRVPANRVVHAPDEFAPVDSSAPAIRQIPPGPISAEVRRLAPRTDRHEHARRGETADSLELAQAAKHSGTADDGWLDSLHGIRVDDLSN